MRSGTDLICTHLANVMISPLKLRLSASTRESEFLYNSFKDLVGVGISGLLYFFLIELMSLVFFLGI
jgi:hypothetical protein